MAATTTNNPRQYIQWKVLLVCPNAQMSKELAPLLSENLPFAPVMELKDYPARADLADMLQSQTPNIALVDVATNPEWALSIVSDLSALDAKLPVVALHEANNSDFILRCLRMGSSEFLLQPFTGEQFNEVIDRIAVHYRMGRGNGSMAKVVVVMPAKGACGASTVASSLAFQWKRMGVGRVLLADLDPLTGTLSFQLKLRQTYSFMDALSRHGALDADVWKGLVYNSGGVDVLLAPEKPVHGIDEGYDPSSLIEFIRLSYEMVAIDTSGAYGRWPLSLARHADDILLVTTNELPALQATQRVLAYLDRNRVERPKIKVVVNRYSQNVGLNQDVIEAALHTEIYQTIASDYEAVQAALVDGKPIPQTTNIGKSLSALAQKVYGKEIKAAKEPKPSGGLGSLLSSLWKK